MVTAADRLVFKHNQNISLSTSRKKNLGEVEENLFPAQTGRREVDDS